jgi:hypothetical protein
MAGPMNDRSWLLALATANLVVLLAGAWLIDRRLHAVEQKTAQARAATAEKPRPARPTPPKEGEESLRDQIVKLGNDSYDQYSEIKSDLYELRQGMTRVQAALRRVNAAVAKPGQPGGQWNLAPAGDALPPETLAAYRRDAEAMGVRIGDGLVEVRGFLNMSPDRSYPIEFFVTRWPESGHETLIHVVGSWQYDPSAGSDALKGLVTAIYKGLIVAGFVPGEPSGFVPAPDPKKGRGTWIPPKGDVVHLGVRYRLRGKTHVARASDWVVDPAGETPTVLPEDAWRFTGGLRMEDMRTGDEMLSAEASSKVVSVFQDWNTLVEIAVASNVDNAYQYNGQRIPKPETIVVLGEPKEGLRLFARLDRREGTFTVTAVEKDGAALALAEPPVLVVEPAPESEGEDGAKKPVEEVPFSRGEGGDLFVVRHEELQNRRSFGRQVTIRAKVDGRTVVSTGTEPLYLDLILSKTPIVPVGDGAKPLERIEIEGEPVRGTGSSADDVTPEGAAPPKATEEK